MLNTDAFSQITFNNREADFYPYRGYLAGQEGINTLHTQVLSSKNEGELTYICWNPSFQDSLF